MIAGDEGDRAAGEAAELDLDQLDLDQLDLEQHHELDLEQHHELDLEQHQADVLDHQAAELVAAAPTVELVTPGRQARGYTWPPFAPGHELSLRHGAWSDRKVDPIAVEIRDHLLALADADGSPVAFLLEASYAPTVWRWARAEARITLLSAWLLEHGEVDGDGEVRPASGLLERLERRQIALSAQMGLTPLSRARLGRDVAAASVDLARLLSGLDGGPVGEGGGSDAA